MTLLSLVLMVKNEAEVLSNFLAHHRDLYDELVIVDTGSTDDSVAIARAAGARVVEETWNDDFSAARNRGLAEATSEWILILDADELLAPHDFEGLRRTIRLSSPQVMIQETINYCPDPTHLEWRPVSGRYPDLEQGQSGYFAARRAGLFPNLSEIRFQGRIHETVLPSAQKAGLSLCEVQLPVHHYGYVRSQIINQERQQRYLKLAELKCQDDPQDWAAVLELATAHLERGAVEEAIPLLEKLALGTPGLRPVVRGRFLLGRIRREKGELETAATLLEETVRQDPGFVFGWLELIRCRAQQESWTAVGDLLQRAGDEFGTDDPLLGKENLRFLIKTGQLPAASAQASDLARQYPNWSEMGQLAARLLPGAGRSG